MLVTHLVHTTVSIPGSAGAEGVATTSTNAAETGLDFATGATVQGVEYHTAADFLADGLKMSFSASTDWWCCCWNNLQN